jgi:hypothetical protein
MMMERSGVEASMHNPRPLNPAQQTQEEVPIPTAEEQLEYQRDESAKVFRRMLELQDEVEQLRAQGQSSASGSTRARV